MIALLLYQQHRQLPSFFFAKISEEGGAMVGHGGAMGNWIRRLWCLMLANSLPSMRNHQTRQWSEQLGLKYVDILWMEDILHQLIDGL